MEQENTNELADLLREMGEDPDKDNETVKAVSQAAETKESNPPGKAPGTGENDDYKAVFEYEPLFDDDPKHPEDIKFMLGGDVVEVTDEDKSLYLKAILNDVPLKLKIEFANGISVTCRAITPYERSLVPYAVAKHFELLGDSRIGSAFLEDYARQYLMAMQVVAIGTKQEEYLSFNSAEGTQKDHILELAKKGKVKSDNYSIAKFNLLIKALNIFENKLARLNTAALKQDFWGPVDAG